MKRGLLFLLALSLCTSIQAVEKDTLQINNFRYCGPYQIEQVFMIDSIDVNGKEYNPTKAQLDAHLSLDVLSDALFTNNLPVSSSAKELHLAGYRLETSDFTKVKLLVEGIKDFIIFLDGKKYEKDTTLEPGSHDVAIKYITSETAEEKPFKIAVVSDKIASLKTVEDGSRIFSLDLNTQGISCAGVKMSANGIYYSIKQSNIDTDGKKTSFTEIYETSSGNLLLHGSSDINWMPTRDEYYYTASTTTGRDLITVNPKTKEETVFIKNLPNGNFRIAPSEDYLIFTINQDGPKEGEVHEILTPDDRQPGWRDRSYLSIFNIASGRMQQLTYGYRNSYLSDISDDGRYLLISTMTDDLSARPSTYTSLYLMDLQTKQTKCLVERDGFIASASFSPDGKQLIVIGSPEAFDKIGMNLPEGLIPNMYDYQLYLFNIEDKQVTPLTKNFDPGVQEAKWSRYDGKIYFIAEDKDCLHLFRINPKNAKAEMLDCKEDYVEAFSLSKSSPNMIYFGESLLNFDKAYMMDCKSGKQQLLLDLHNKRFNDVKLAQGGAYEFTSSRGDKINGFYVLPVNFDPNKKYPMIVHYYGGCSPSSRYFVGSYSPQLYSSQGYIFYVVNPSGASGFGQEFASRHVNTAGDVVVDDIIEGVENFCKDHPFVDTNKIGCFSASYGGFMTQLLLAKSDIFTTGISHAGISDHSSYWGEGYWGYSYSQVSMANNFPWNAKELYVDRSPLYMADQIKEPILFLHGSADTNVPIGESIQMFTAMKLLGVETSFVVVDGENHGIQDYAKRRQWLRTISAWFAKYLKDDSTWWDELYPPKTL